MIDPIDSWDTPDANDKLDKLAKNRRNEVAAWPTESLRICVESGLFVGLVGDAAWSERWGIAAYLRLAQLDLVTAFVVTQLMGAAKRIHASNNQTIRECWLGQLLSGRQFATVGISHLTTSRQHLGHPVLSAKRDRSGWILDGSSPWVTGAAHAALLVIGATTEDRSELLVAVPANREGIILHPGLDLLGLTASCTDQVAFQNVRVEDVEILAGPIDHVLSTGSSGGTGGLQTSTLAIGLARAASNYLMVESEVRHDLRLVALELARSVDELEHDLFLLVDGAATCTTHELRSRANSLVMRCTQAALATAKGAGYVAGHPVGRWCQEALFFLVWSCPSPVAKQQLCELARIR